MPSFAQKAVDYDSLISDCLASVKNQQFAKAVDFCTDALREKSDSGMAYYLRAVSYNKMSVDTATKSPSGEAVKISIQQRIQFTVSDAEKCLQFIPNEYPCYSLIGSVLYKSNDKIELEKAVKNLNEGIRLGDKNKDLYLYRGVANFSLAKTFSPKDANAVKYAEQAIADFTTLMQKNPSDDFNYFRRSDVYEFLGKYNLAIADLSKFLESNKVDEQAIFARGKLYLANQQYQLAIDDFTNALAIADDSDNYDFDDFQKEILPLRMKAYKALKNKTAFCTDLKILDETANCDKEWKKK